MERSGTIKVVKDLCTFSFETGASEPLDIMFISAVSGGSIVDALLVVALLRKK